MNHDSWPLPSQMLDHIFRLPFEFYKNSCTTVTIDQQRGNTVIFNKLKIVSVCKSVK